MPRKIETHRPVGHDRRPAAAPDNDEHRRFIRTARWQNFQKWYLRHFPVCGTTSGILPEGNTTGCGRPATTAHHLVDRRESDPSTWLRAESCQALCHRCHSGETWRRLHGPGLQG